ncbi:cdp-diacylglycerol--inositol 3-phosphatidyltransferase 1 [Quercus suber]|uniref:Cdp-diacylglycerol--inositol 3-phosphatidyltransferase 1 n=1 Tax=Quercus suber TaxID=58331 RepID=A0AAW0LS32_QUESU
MAFFCSIFFSFVFDALDGWCARKFNQVSTFGSVLDKVVDRISTGCLLVILSKYTGKVSHKDVKDSSNWLFKAYYGNRMFMAYCCVAVEVLYIVLFLLAENQTESLMDVLMRTAKQSLLISSILALSFFGCAIKQIVNVIQMKTAADLCVLYDIDKKQKP